MRSWKQMSGALKLGIIATVILALSIVGVLAAERFGAEKQDDAVKARAQEGPDPDDARRVRKPLELGAVAKISPNYSVAVTDVSLYEGSNRQVMVATVKAEYIGNDDGEPWADLVVEFSDSRSKTSGESDCPAGLGSASDEPALAAGDVTTHEVCMNLPTDETKGGRIFVEEAFSSSGDRISWSTSEAVTKPLPAAPKPRSGSRAPAVQSQHQPGNGDDDRAQAICDEFDEDEFEDYKEWGDQIKKHFEAYKDAGGNDEDELDDYEDWKDEYDKQIDAFEKLADAC